MLCLIAGNIHEARTFATGQNLDDSEWFYPKNSSELLFRSNFHVLVIGTAGHNTPSMFFERIYELAQKRGRIGRD